MNNKSPASKGFLSLSEEILGEGYYPPKTSIFSRLFGFFRTRFGRFRNN